MKRHAPEEQLPGAGPLFDYARPSAPPSTWPEREAAMNAAGEHAERIERSWLDGALAQVRAFARRTPAFICEEIGVAVPEGADRRALGALMHAALRAGIVARGGFRPAHDGSPKTLWTSLVYEGPR